MFSNGSWTKLTPCLITDIAFLYRPAACIAWSGPPACLIMWNAPGSLPIMYVMKNHLKRNIECMFQPVRYSQKCRCQIRLHIFLFYSVSAELILAIGREVFYVDSEKLEEVVHFPQDCLMRPPSFISHLLLSLFFFFFHFLDFLLFLSRLVSLHPFYLIN